MSWQEKSAQAKALAEDVKKMHREGIDDGEKATEVRRKLADAQRLSAEARAEKLADDNSAIDTMLKSFDLNDASADSNWGAGPISTSTGSIADTKSALKVAEDPFGQSKETRIVASEKALKDFGMKALAEGTTTAGGFLVPPQYLQDQFAEVRRAGNTLRRLGWLNVHPVETNTLLMPKGGGSATVGWVAENATKPSADQSFSQITINIHTAAGISKLSKQLVDDSSPTAVDLATRELASLMALLEEQAALNGSGTGQPRGILNTTGVNNIAVGTNTAAAVVDAILDGIVAIQSTYFGAPNGILMHPRRMGFLQKAKDSNGAYLFTSPGSRAPGAGAGLGVGQAAFDLLGLPVGISANIPTNLGVGLNQDAIIVADWNEAHWFQRQDVTLDASDVAGTAFEQNQVWFRLEQRAGFSAERYASAFSVLSGAGLVP